MCKKVWIAGVAVAVALSVITFTRVGSHLRVWKKDFSTYVQQQIPPEQEIARLKMDLDNLAKEDDRHFDRVAKQIVEVKRLEATVSKLKEEHKIHEARLVEMTRSLVGEEKLVTYKGEKYDRSRLQAEYRQSGQRFQVDEETLKSKDEQLSLKKQSLESNRKKLADLKLVREQMRTELVRLETALTQERQAQAAEEHTLDDASYRNLRKEVDAVKDRIEVLKQKRVLRGDVESPIRATEQRKEQEQAIDNYLNARFGDKQ